MTQLSPSIRIIYDVIKYQCFNFVVGIFYFAISSSSKARSTWCFKNIKIRKENFCCKKHVWKNRFHFLVCLYNIISRYRMRAPISCPSKNISTKWRIYTRNWTRPKSFCCRSKTVFFLFCFLKLTRTCLFHKEITMVV